MAKKGNFFRNLTGAGDYDEDEGFVDYDNGYDGSYDTSSSAVTDEEADSVGDYSERMQSAFGSSRAINLHNSTDRPKISVMQPASYDEVMSDAVNLLRDGTIIFLNLNDVDNENAIRIVDFMTGVAAAFEGRIKKVYTRGYAIAPKNVDWISPIDD